MSSCTLATLTCHPRTLVRHPRPFFRHPREGGDLLAFLLHRETIPLRMSMKIPAFAGMTKEGAAMTANGVAMTANEADIAARVKR